MSRIDKLLERLRNNPKDVTRREIETLADHFGIARREGKHTVFYVEGHYEQVPIPRDRRVRPAYVRHFLGLVDSAIQSKGDSDE